MKQYYEKSLQKIKELSRILTEKEWNEIAYKENLLSSESIKYISNMKFEDVCMEVKK